VGFLNRYKLSERKNIMSEFDAAIFSPMNYLKVFFRRKKMIIIPVVIGLVAGICTAILLPKSYQSTTTILVQESKTDNPLFSKLAVSTTVRQRITSIRESILGWNSLVELVKRLNLDKDVKDQLEYEALIEGLRKSIIIRLQGGNILKLSYIGEDPAQTKEIVESMADIFIDKNITVQSAETDDAISFIEEQLQLYKGKIKSAEISELQDALDDLLIDSTDKHPRVVQIRLQITNLKEQLRKENLEFTESLTLKPATDSPLVDEIKKSLNKLDGKSNVVMGTPSEPGADEEYYKLMMLDKLETALARDVQVNESIYSMLLNRLETAKITKRLQSSKDGTHYEVLDPARLALKPIKPNKPLIAVMGLFMGIAFGVVLVFVVEFLDQSFLDVEDAKSYLGVPLLGAISKIETNDTIRVRREKDTWLYAVLFIISIAFVVLAKAVSNFVG
jgi:uncharacterized protein involved in exopolysaccharide biosynthesis